MLSCPRKFWTSETKVLKKFRNQERSWILKAFLSRVIDPGSFAGKWDDVVLTRKLGLISYT
jgi:hypothetical protein